MHEISRKKLSAIGYQLSAISRQSGDGSQRAHQRWSHRFATQAQEPQRQRHRPPNFGRELDVVERRGQPGQPGLRARAECEPGFITADQDVLQTEHAAGDTESRHVEERLRFRREGPEALTHFVAEPINVAR
jgi:hypothetical protein